jgi:hypothetical protein
MNASISDSDRRKHIRIALKSDLMDDLGFSSEKGTLVFDEKVVVPCQIQNFSYSGALVGIKENIIINHNAKMFLSFLSDTYDNDIRLPGYIVRLTKLDKYQSPFGVGIKFYNDSLPVQYKNIISDYWIKHVLQA